MFAPPIDSMIVGVNGGSKQQMLHYWTEWTVKKLKVPTHRRSISAQVILNWGFITILVTATSRQAKHWATWESHLKCWSLINILWAGCLLMWLRVCGFSFNAVCHPGLCVAPCKDTSGSQKHGSISLEPSLMTYLLTNSPLVIHLREESRILAKKDINLWMLIPVENASMTYEAVLGKCLKMPPCLSLQFFFFWHTTVSTVIMQWCIILFIFSNMSLLSRNNNHGWVNWHQTFVLLHRFLMIMKTRELMQSETPCFSTQRLRQPMK